MDFVSAMRFQDEMYEWWMSLSEEEREQGAGYYGSGTDVEKRE